MREAEKEVYQLHARMPMFRKRVKESIEFIQKANNETSPWVICYSGGKDSTVLLDLCTKHGEVKDMMFGVYPETPKENMEMAGGMANHYGLHLHFVSLPGAFDVYVKVGHAFFDPYTKDERTWTNWMLKKYKAVMNDFVEKNGWNGQFLGMRMKESKARMFALSKKKDLYQTKDRKGWTGTPLFKWSGNDIWAYIIEHDLPYLNVYDNDMQERERTRSEPTFLASEAIWRHGHGAFIQKYHPDIWEKAQKWPEINRYT